jgi:hypothetical protein
MVDWLTSVAALDGHWYADTKNATTDDHVIASGLAGVVYLGNGEKPPAEACGWLERQQPAGSSAAAVQVLFLAERFGMYQQGRVAADAALARLAALQQPDGTWRERGADGADQNVYPTMWAVLALKSAKMAGLLAAGPMLLRAHDGLAQAPIPAQPDAFVVQQCTRSLLGWKREDLWNTVVQQSLERAPDAGTDARIIYAKTLLAFQCGAMPGWRDHLADRFATQLTDGSFESAGGLDSVATTALLALCSEITMRFAGTAPPPPKAAPADAPKEF